MHKFLMIPIMALLMSLILGSGLAAFTNSNSASAQNYGYSNDYGETNYSTYPSDDKPYECRTGPLEGFFVSSVEFCKQVKLDDRKDHNRDRDNKTGQQGPPGPQGPQGPQGPPGPGGGQIGPQGPPGEDGAQGPIGPIGPIGPDGTQGIQGPIGPIGPNGTQGIQGPIGPIGPNGTQGIQGPPGANGTQVELFECDDDSNLPGANVTDPRLCFAATPAVQCPSGTTLEGVWVNSTFGLAACDLNVCPIGTDLEGVLVNNTSTDCDADFPEEFVPDCLKCADLALVNAGGQAQQEDVSIAFIGNTTVNVFTVCNDTTTATSEFNAIIDELEANNTLNEGQADELRFQFSTCLDNAAASHSEAIEAAQAQISSLQENSLTTNVKPEAEILSLNTEPNNPFINPLLKNPHLEALLENPNIDALLADPSGKALLENPNVKALLEDPEVDAFLKDKAIKAQQKAQQFPH